MQVRKEGWSGERDHTLICVKSVLLIKYFMYPSSYDILSCILEQLAAIWLTFRLDMIGVLMVTLISLLSVLEHHFGGVDAGTGGLFSSLNSYTQHIH